MTLSAKQDALIEDLNFLPDPQERLAEIVRRGTRHALPDSLKTPDRRVPGCVSTPIQRAAPWSAGEVAPTPSDVDATR